ncbi:hypothetical protein L596_008917 [Steinernema carpocapsae]|uniref:Uncharacterized protein n=1 Tax=Steinernema carpocapsae TaxID=34508 RepID=A0A4U5PE68_STECR|nr:hypothetical protein L596_008917 [Steinernema carpocapsae]
MQVKIFVPLLLLLPAVFAGCAEDALELKNLLDDLQFHINNNLSAACDKKTKIEILNYMIANFKVLAFRLKKPCVFTFQPTQFSSNCGVLVSMNYKLYDRLVSINSHLNGMCQVPCSIDTAFYNRVMDYVALLESILNNLIAG